MIMSSPNKVTILSSENCIILLSSLFRKVICNFHDIVTLFGKRNQVTLQNHKRLGHFSCVGIKSRNWMQNYEFHAFDQLLVSGARGLSCHFGLRRGKMILFPHIIWQHAPHKVNGQLLIEMIFPIFFWHHAPTVVNARPQTVQTCVWSGPIWSSWTTLATNSFTFGNRSWWIDPDASRTNAKSI